MATDGYREILQICAHLCSKDFFCLSFRSYGCLK